MFYIHEYINMIGWLPLDVEEHILATGGAFLFPKVKKHIDRKKSV